MISSSEVLKPFKRGTNATELRTSGALEESPLKSVTATPRVRSEAESSLQCTHYVTPKKAQLCSSSEKVQTPYQNSLPEWGLVSISFLSLFHLSFCLVISKSPTRQYLFTHRVKMSHFARGFFCYTFRGTCETSPGFEVFNGTFSTVAKHLL